MTPGSEALPWLVRHGELIGYAAAAAMVLLGMAVALFILRRSATRWAAERRRALGEPTGELASGPVTLAGVLEAEEQTDRLDDGTPCAVTVAVMGPDWVGRRPEGLCLKVGDETVALEGPIDVAVGSYERSFAPEAPASHPELAGRIAAAPDQRELDEGSEWAVRALDAGDRVIARGTLERRAETRDAEGDYRTAGARLHLRPREEDGVIGLAALRPPGARPRTRLLVALLGAAAGLAALYGGGRAALATLPDTHDEAPPALSLGAQLATACPFHRDLALSELELSFVEGPGPWDRRRAEVALALGGEDACGQVLSAVQRAHRLEDLVAVAVWCERTGPAADQLLAEARFELASDLYEAHPPAEDPNEWKRAGFAHLLAGHRDRAAEAARAEADHLPDYQTPWHADSLRCLAWFLEPRDGGQEALAELDAARERGDEVARGICALLFAEAAARDEAAEDHGEIPIPRLFHDWLGQVVRASRGSWPQTFAATGRYSLRPDIFPPTDPPIAMIAGVALHDRLLEQPPALVERWDALDEEGTSIGWELEPQVAPEMLYAGTGTLSANAHSLLGDAETARARLATVAPYVASLTRYLDRRTEGPEPADLGFDERRLPDLIARFHITAALVELRDGRPEAAEPHLDRAARYERWARAVRSLRAAARPAPETMQAALGRQLSFRPEAGAALAAAAGGDAGPLEEQIQESGWIWLARVTAPDGDKAGASLLASAIRGAGPSADPIRASLAEADPLAQIGYLPYGLFDYARRRAVARAAGADRAEEAIADALARYRERLSDPVTSLALAVWFEL